MVTGGEFPHVLKTSPPRMVNLLNRALHGSGRRIRNKEPGVGHADLRCFSLGEPVSGVGQVVVKQKPRLWKEVTGPERTGTLLPNPLDNI